MPDRYGRGYTCLGAGFPLSAARTVFTATWHLIVGLNTYRPRLGLTRHENVYNVPIFTVKDSKGQTAMKGNRWQAVMLGICTASEEVVWRICG